MEGPLQRQQQRSVKYRAVIAEAARLKAADLSKLQSRLQQRQDKIARLRTATENEKRLLGDCELCTLMQAQAWGMGHKQWFSRKCSSCFTEQAAMEAERRQLLQSQGRPADILSHPTPASKGSQLIAALDLSNIAARPASCSSSISQTAQREAGLTADAAGTATYSIGLPRSAQPTRPSEIAMPCMRKGLTSQQQQEQLRPHQTLTVQTGTDTSTAAKPRWQLAMHIQYDDEQPGNDIAVCPSSSPWAASRARPATATAAISSRAKLRSSDDAVDGACASDDAHEASTQDRARRAHNRAAKMQQLEEACREAEHIVVFGITLKERTKAMQRAGDLRSQLADLRRLARSDEKARHVEHYQRASKGKRCNTSVCLEHSVAAGHSRHHVPHPAVALAAAQEDAVRRVQRAHSSGMPSWLDAEKGHHSRAGRGTSPEAQRHRAYRQTGSPRRLQQGASCLTADALCVSNVTWRPAPSGLPLRHPEGWQAAGEYVGEYDPSADLARLRSLRVDDFKTRRKLECDWQRALRESMLQLAQQEQQQAQDQQRTQDLRPDACEGVTHL